VKILLVTPSLPHPPIWGFNIRVHRFLKHLSRRHEVSLLSYLDPDEDHGALEALAPLCATIQTVVRPADEHRSRRSLQLRSLVSPRSFHGRRLWSAEMQRAIDRALSEEKFDVVQVESSRLGVFDFGGHPVTILDEHNLEYELLERTSRIDQFPPRKAYTWLEHVKFRREERRCWTRFSGCVLTSDREKAVVNNYGHSVSTAVVPNGVDIDYFRPSDGAVDADSIVFTGLMTYRPNADGAAYFIRDVLPLIRRSRPRARFTAVGWGLPDELKGLLGDGVIHTGRVADVRPYLAAASVVVVPLRMGSGTRLKVLEGFAMGKALVSTTLGCEGVNVEAGRQLLVADDPQRFAEAVLALMDDPERRRRLGLEARCLVENEYRWETVVERLERFHADRVSAAPQRLRQQVAP
jgi:polysaccharide biosynthesis protein PslH